MTEPCDIIAYDRNGHELMKDDVVCVYPELWIGSLVGAYEGRCLVRPAGSEVDGGGVAVECPAESLSFVSR
jgi:hypothetical protein